MAVSTAPASEACAAIVARINSGGAYTLPSAADYSEVIVDPLEGVGSLRVDVTTEDERQPDETLESEERSRHTLRVWVRKKVSSKSKEVIDPLKLIVRQIFLRLNNYKTSRIQVWEIDAEAKQCPDKVLLDQHGVFIASLVLTVEVEPS